MTGYRPTRVRDFRLCKRWYSLTRTTQPVRLRDAPFWPSAVGLRSAGVQRCGDRTRRFGVGRLDLTDSAMRSHGLLELRG